MYGNPAFDCDGTQIRAHCRQLATVVTITGDIDGTNVDRVGQYVRRFILAEKPIILDLSGVNSFSSESISLLYTVDDRSRAAGVQWSLVASRLVGAALRHDLDEFPVAGSVPEALNQFADEMLKRRRLLPLLTKSA
jgi:anti-anti-sigma factor